MTAVSYCNTSFSQIDQAFGGLYQICTMDKGNVCSDKKITQRNPQTGNMSCPAGYTAVKLYQGAIYTSYGYVYYDTYWCVLIQDTPQQYRGYLFGGFFTQTSTNPITGTQSCPPYFYVQKIAIDASICVTNDYEHGGAHHIEFGGFHSCQVGNPLSVPHTNVSIFPNISDWPHSCPQEYSQHLIAIENGCEINVCLEKG